MSNDVTELGTRLHTANETNAALRENVEASIDVLSTALSYLVMPADMEARISVEAIRELLPKLRSSLSTPAPAVVRREVLKDCVEILQQLSQSRFRYFSPTEEAILTAAQAELKKGEA
jgi:hypothetical protein